MIAGQPLARLTFVGTGEAFDAERPNTSLLYEGSATLLLDCGFAVPQPLWRLPLSPEQLDAVFVTHCHADHCFGLPALVGWMRLAGRHRPLHLFGGPGAADFIPRVLELGYRGAGAAGRGFPLHVEEIVPGRRRALAGLTLTTAASMHSRPNHAIRVDDNGRSFAYSGDGSPTPDTRTLYRGVHQLIHECLSPAPAVAGHACFEEVAQLAETAAVSSLYLVHVAREPAIRARVRALATRHRGTTRIELPSAGLTVSLP